MYTPTHSIDIAAPPLTFTERAAAKTLEFIQEEQVNALLKLWLFVASAGLYESAALRWCAIFQEEANLKLKVFITGGGCHGFRYDFELTGNVEPDDMLIPQTVNTGENASEKTTVILLIDAVSLQYLRGAEIDYQCDLQGERFIIRNLKAKTTCGCGSSFAV